jgi:hypothetical protein
VILRIAVCQKWVPDPAPVEVSSLIAVFDLLRGRGLLADDMPPMAKRRASY